VRSLVIGKAGRGAELRISIFQSICFCLFVFLLCFCVFVNVVTMLQGGWIHVNEGFVCLFACLLVCLFCLLACLLDEICIVVVEVCYVSGTRLADPTFSSTAHNSPPRLNGHKIKSTCS
jgi:hypothetical protein